MATSPTSRVDVVRTHLEMRSIDALRRSRPPSEDARLARRHLTPDEYRAIYSLVGERWHWRDRLLLSDEELDRYLASPDVHVWLLTVNEELAGYFELQRYQDLRVEIMYFGLAANFIGRGLGGWMLTRAVEEAFALGATHVTVHTCTLDAPTALPNYLARGFVIVRQERYEHRISP
jgi:GNAT superfamily N-acetyltransferase